MKAKRMKAEKVTAKTAAPATEELIDMDEAIARLRTSRPTFYRWLRSGRIRGMKVGRQWRFYRGDIERFLKGGAPRIELPADISPLLAILDQHLSAKGVKPAPVGEGQSEVNRAVRRMMSLAYAMRGTDIHLTTHPLPGQSGVKGVLRIRVDGVLHVIAEIDPRLMPALVEEWKRLAACDLHERQKPQDGRILIDVSELSGKPGDQQIDMRVSFVPAVLGESLTARLLSPQALLKLDNMRYSDRDLARIRQALALPWGIVLCTGPTGCGKTTTLYACLQEISRPEAKILTVEHPVEYILPWATQLPVNPAVGLTFAAVLRSVLRSDPDAILVGEIRDHETLEVSMQCALTGHLVLTTLHTDNAASALIRMRDIGTNAFIIAEAVKLVVAQRLIRVLCKECSRETTPSAEDLAQCGEIAREGGQEFHSLARRFKTAVGCPKCSSTGYRGRVLIAETLEMTPAIGRALRDGAGADELRRLAVKDGMITMAADGIRRAAEGEISLQEVMRVVALQR